jgi:hypothetical protein
MAFSSNDPNKFTEKQQAEILKLTNEAYDRGGADALKVLIDTVQNLINQADASPSPNKVTVTSSLKIFLTIIDGVRQGLQATVAEAEQKIEVPESRIIF